MIQVEADVITYKLQHKKAVCSQYISKINLWFMYESTQKDMGNMRKKKIH
jgi:hypothetical protein